MVTSVPPRAGPEVGESPKTESGATWSAGMSYEVTWTIEANRESVRPVRI